MSIGETCQGAAACLAVEGEMTIYRAAELQPVLLDAVRTHDAPALDLSEVTEFDCAGMQLLLVARREARRLGPGQAEGGDREQERKRPTAGQPDSRSGSAGHLRQPCRTGNASMNMHNDPLSPTGQAVAQSGEACR